MSVVADKLVEARKLIERGWTQQDYCNSSGAVCTVGALQEAINGRADDCATSAIETDGERLLRKAIGCPSLIAWNDAPGRTRPEVLAAFDRAIELARSESPDHE